jgi:hypothetical protein
LSEITAKVNLTVKEEKARIWKVREGEFLSGWSQKNLTRQGDAASAETLLTSAYPVCRCGED